MKNARDRKLCSLEEAIAAIADGVTVASAGFCGLAHPEGLTAAIERRFLATGHPRDLMLVYAAGQGDAATRGLSHLGHKGLVKRVIGGHWRLAPRLAKLAVDGEIEAYNFPQGVICQLFRDIAAGRPGVITHVGLDTFVDPAAGCGGRVNDATPPGYVQRVELGGTTWLWYQAFPIHVGLIRATAADPLGNLVMDEEGIVGEALPIAQAARNCGGIVMAQVKKLLDHAAPPHQVRVPGVLVDRIVVAEEACHGQTFGEQMNPAYCTAAGADTPAPSLEPLPLDARRIIAARACDELPQGAIANLGIGMPEGIARIAAERGLLDRFTLTIESGPIGGMPAGGLSFGASVHPHAIIDQPAQFDFYDGRGLDFAALGAAQIDEAGNVNVSRFGSTLAGAGGFINITQTAKRLVFCGTFTAGGLEVAVDGGKLRILQEGSVPKFIRRVEQVTFSAAHSRRVGQQVLYVTERAIFRLGQEDLELIELAPGVDLQTQVLALMQFKPVMRRVRTMPPHVFAGAAAQHCSDRRRGPII